MVKDGDNMRINTYDLIIQNDLPMLIKERGFNYKTNDFSPKSIVNMMNEKFNLKDKAEEYVYAIGTCAKGKLVNVFPISKGTVNASLCNPRELLIRMLLAGAVNVILIHNHPSKDVNPSKDDMNVSIRLKDACKLIGLSFCDSIIIGGNNYCSFNECGII